MAKRGRKTRGIAGYMISAVAEMYNIHPQTLRLYEREGLLIPSRSEGNTRLYTPEDLEQLETILNLTRDLGVNLAGIDIIMNMRRRMRQMQEEMQAFVDYVQKEFLVRSEQGREGAQNAMVRITPVQIIRSRRTK
jgi:MerR family transcriptional regulator/heat shock protein HspR